jgi:ribosomal subunit interface protein
MRERQALVPRPGSSTSGHRRAIMPLRVSGKNIKIGEALRGRINARLAEAMAKYFDGGFSGHVTIGRDGFGFRTECVVHLDSGIVLEAEALAADAYASADQAAIRIETRLRRTSVGARIVRGRATTEECAIATRTSAIKPTRPVLLLQSPRPTSRNRRRAIRRSLPNRSPP